VYFVNNLNNVNQGHHVNGRARPALRQVFIAYQQPVSTKELVEVGEQEGSIHNYVLNIDTQMRNIQTNYVKKKLKTQLIFKLIKDG